MQYSDNISFDEEALNSLVNAQNEFSSRELQQNTLIREHLILVSFTQTLK